MSTDLVHAFFALCWIVLIAFAGVFSYAFVRWVSFAIWPVRAITINHYHNGVLIESKKVDLKSNELLVAQLPKNRKEGHRD